MTGEDLRTRLTRFHNERLAPVLGVVFFGVVAVGIVLAIVAAFVG